MVSTLLARLEWIFNDHRSVDFFFSALNFFRTKKKKNVSKRTGQRVLREFISLEIHTVFMDWAFFYYFFFLLFIYGDTTTCEYQTIRQRVFVYERDDEYVWGGSITHAAAVRLWPILVETRAAAAVVNRSLT